MREREGTILNDHQICYKYGKLKGVREFVFFMPVMIGAVLTALACICLKTEKEDLYQVLKRICSMNRAP